MICQFCSQEVAQVRYIAGVSRLKQDLATLATHLNDIHKVTRGKAILMVVEGLVSQEGVFLERVLEEYNMGAGGRPGQVDCAFCSDHIVFDIEIGGGVRVDNLTEHFKLKHNILELGNFLVELNMLNVKKRTQLVETFLLKHGFRTHKYNSFHAALKAETKLEITKDDPQKLILIESKLSEKLENPPAEGEYKRPTYKIRSDKGIKKGKMVSALNRPKKVLKCEFCPYTPKGVFSGQPHKMRRHLRRHTGEKPYVCDMDKECNEKFITSYELNGHKRRKHTREKRFCCYICGKAFITSPELKLHSYIQHSVERLKTLKCDICDYCTDLDSNLRTHKKIHFPAVKTFDCDKCNKVFRNRPRLSRHQTSLHDENAEKRYKCEHCNRPFLERYNMKQHIDLVHNNVQRFVCKECGKSLTKRCDLLHHIEVNHPDTTQPPQEWNCIECNKTYPHSRALKHHTRLVHNTTPKYPCDPCGHMFKTKFQLLLHSKREAHKNNEMKMCLKKAKLSEELEI